MKPSCVIGTYRFTPCIVPMGSKRHARQWKSVRLHVTDRYSFLPAQRGRTVPNLFFPFTSQQTSVKKVLLEQLTLIVTYIALFTRFDTFKGRHIILLMCKSIYATK